MRLWRSVSALALAAMLSACAAPALQIEGPVLQGGPVEAPTIEIAMETRGTCEMFLRNFSWSLQRGTRCAPALSGLPYVVDIDVDVFGTLTVRTRTLAACEELRKKELDKGAKSPLKKIGECHEANRETK